MTEAGSTDPPTTTVSGGRRGWGWGGGWGGASGPEVARLFHRLLAVVFLIAWVSLATQVRLLVGSRGLLPLADFVEAARAQGVLSIRTFPSVLALVPTDGVLLVGTFAGMALALLGLGGLWPRLCCALQTVLYLGYATACRTFLSFQWDNLLLECTVLAVFLPVDRARVRARPVAHLLFRALLFKLYFESGIAKWQSPLFDWRDGSAMTFYYETAPLPTAIAWYAHHLPRWWHLFESRATLVVELVVPFAAFGPRRARLTAAAALTLFQVLNAATANYGFFCFLSLALHVFLLDDQDVRRAGAFFQTRARGVFGIHRPPPTAAALPAGPPARSSARRRLVGTASVIGAAAWVFVSVGEAMFHFGDPGPATTRVLVPVLELEQAFRLVNTYHLFAAVTRERIEPEFQLLVDGDWTAVPFRYKPGDLARAPRFVAPHQPRVDFQLWFYGLAHQRRQPAYVAELAARLCEAPDAVAALFPGPVPRRPRSVRIAFWRYNFTSPAERRATGNWWSRHPVDVTDPMPCNPPQ